MADSCIIALENRINLGVIWCPLVLTFPWWLRWYRICLQCGRPRFIPGVGKILWRRDRLPTPVLLGFPCSSDGQESSCNAGDLGLISGLGRSPGEGNSYPFHYSGLENSIDYSPWGHKEMDRTKQLSLSFSSFFSNTVKTFQLSLSLLYEYSQAFMK